MHHPKIKYCHWIDSPYTLNQGKFLCTDLFPFLWVSILIFLAVLWISRKKSMRLNCDVLCLWFSHMPTVCSLLLVALTAVRRIYHLLCLQQYLWSAQHRSIPSWCACCKSSINFTNKLKCVEEWLHTFVSSVCHRTIIQQYSSYDLSLFLSTPPLSHHPPTGFTRDLMRIIWLEWYCCFRHFKVGGKQAICYTNLCSRRLCDLVIRSVILSWR